jgi:type VI secretion system protein ImpM
MPVAAPRYFSAPGLFGKIPAQGDFVRVQASDPAARALALWLEAGSEPVRRRGLKTGPALLRFVLHPSATSRVLVGVLGESRDKVGREFPLAVFVGADAPDLRESFPALPVALRPVLDGAASLIAEAPSLAVSDLPARLGLLPVPDAAILEKAPAGATGPGATEPAAGLLARLFGEPDSGQPLYAVHCVRSACEPVRSQEPAVARAVLDCPAQEDLDRWIWLEMARRLLRWSGPPSFLWRESQPARLLLSLGPPPPSIFGTLCDDAQTDGKLWPLTTQVQGAVEAARRSLGPSVVRSIENPNQTVADMVGAATS